MLGVALTAASACGGGSDQTQLERELQDKAGSDILPVELGLVDCPEDVVVTPESVFICASEVAGQYYELQVRIIDKARTVLVRSQAPPITTGEYRSAAG